MKNLFFALVVLACSLIANTLHGQPTSPKSYPGVKLPTGVLEYDEYNFYNLEDAANSFPYMTIVFINPKKEITAMDTWRNEIDKKISAAGGVRTGDDYKKITPIITDYINRFVETGSDMIYINFPRVKQSLLLTPGPKK
jgi:hypothetical protein